MFEKISEWIKSHNGVTHIVAVGIATIVTLYENVPQFHDFLISIYTAIPHGFQTVVTTAIAVYMWYRRGSDPQQ